MTEAKVVDPRLERDGEIDEVADHAARLAQDLVGLLAAGPLERDLLELLLELLRGQLAPLEAVAGVHDFLDVELEDVAPAELGLRPLAAAQEHAEPAPALLERELDLLANLVVVGDGLLRLAGKRHPDRRHVNEYDHRARGQSAPGLCDAVVAPTGIEDRLEGGASRLLVKQGHAVGVADDARQLAVVLAVLPLGERDGGRRPGRRLYLTQRIHHLQAIRKTVIGVLGRRPVNDLIHFCNYSGVKRSDVRQRVIDVFVKPFDRGHIFKGMMSGDDLI